MGKSIIKVIGALAIIFFLTIIGLSLFNVYDIFQNTKSNEILSNYNVKDDIIYNVLLKDNDYFTEKVIESDGNYISQLVDEINTTFSFEFNGLEDVVYKYFIKGNLIAKYRDNMTDGEPVEIWNETKEYENIPYNEAPEDLKFSEDVIVDFEYLTNKIISLQNELEIPIKADYHLELAVDLVFDNNGDPFTKKHIAAIDIPINTNVFDISETTVGDLLVDIISEKEQEEINKTELLLMALLIMASSIMIFFIMKYVFIEKLSEFEETINEIFQIYEDRIAVVEDFSPTKGTKFIDLLEFEELIEVVDELNLHILCWYKTDFEIWFCAIKDNIIYRYIEKK